MAENEKPDMANYVHCAKHDIFFNKRLKEEADEENKKLKRGGLLERVDACPMCKQEFALTLLKIHAPQPHLRVFPYPNFPLPDPEKI